MDKGHIPAEEVQYLSLSGLALREGGDHGTGGGAGRLTGWIEQHGTEPRGLAECGPELSDCKRERGEGLGEKREKGGEKRIRSHCISNFVGISLCTLKIELDLM